MPGLVLASIAQSVIPWDEPLPSVIPVGRHEDAVPVLIVARFDPAKAASCNAHRLDRSEIVFGDLASRHGTAPGQRRLWRADRLDYPDPYDGRITQR